MRPDAARGVETLELRIASILVAALFCIAAANAAGADELYEANAADLVASFRYHDRMSGIPVHDEQGTRDRPYDLTVSFDAAKIDAALRSLGLEPWKEPRQRLALFIGVQNGPTPYVLTSDGER